MMTYEKIKAMELKALEERALSNPCYKSMVAVAEYASANGFRVDLEAGAWTVEFMPGDIDAPACHEVVSPHWDRWRF